MQYILENSQFFTEEEITKDPVWPPPPPFTENIGERRIGVAKNSFKIVKNLAIFKVRRIRFEIAVPGGMEKR